MPPAQPLSRLLADLTGDRQALRGERGPVLVVGTLRRGVALWESAIADFDAGADAAVLIDSVERALTPDGELAAEIARSRDVFEHGVPLPVDRFLLTVAPELDALVERSRTVVGALRKAVALERRSRSRWRGTGNRATALVDRDLVMEDVRVRVRGLLEQTTALIDALDRFLARSSF
ncbi:hypothetical protein [Actinokineospora spheciospongiae]|uniref:hypothetical protein n=1 Tax=Actinokineospora spheciospongiae TaxID=909613 RepID=UPI000D70EC15|nr:hypothetical protein [Actinokineospora spheciospongiae]PWW62628.1 hypothetical protein DFQ13_105444 [Actinokineospora spheciospongiae]